MSLCTQPHPYAPADEGGDQSADNEAGVGEEAVVGGEPPAHREDERESRVGRRRRTRIRQRLNRFGYRYAWCGRAMVGECDRRLVWQEPGVRPVRESLCDKRFQPARCGVAGPHRAKTQPRGRVTYSSLARGSTRTWPRGWFLSLHRARPGGTGAVCGAPAGPPSPRWTPWGRWRRPSSPPGRQRVPAAELEKPLHLMGIDRRAVDRFRPVSREADHRAAGRLVRSLVALMGCRAGSSTDPLVAAGCPRARNRFSDS